MCIGEEEQHGRRGSGKVKGRNKHGMGVGEGTSGRGRESSERLQSRWEKAK